MAVAMDRSKYRNPDMPVGYVKKNPELKYKEGVEIDGVHYVWAPFIYDAHMDEMEDFATLSDLVFTSDEECIIEATVKAPASRKIKKEKIEDASNTVDRKTVKHVKKGYDSENFTLDASLSHLDIEDKSVKRKKKIKIKKERRRSGSSSSPTSVKHISPVHSRMHVSPSSHRYRSPSPGDRKHHRSPSPGDRKHHRSPSSHRHRSPLSSHRHHSPSSSKRYYSSPSRDKVVTFSSSPSPERYMDLKHEIKVKQEMNIKQEMKIKQEYIKKEHFDEVKLEPLEPPEHLHGSYHCSTCNITMNSLLTYNTHLNGKRHRKNLKVKNVPEAVAASIPATVVSEDQSKYPKVPPGIIRRKVQRPAEIQEVLETYIKQPCPGLHFVTEIKGLDAVHYYCYLCDSVCSSNSITAHLTGFKHQLKTVKQYKPGDYEYMQNEPKYKIENELKNILRAIQKKEGMGRMAVEEDEIDSSQIPYGPPMPPRDFRNIPSTSRGITREQSDMSFKEKYDKATVPDMTRSGYVCKTCQSHMNSLEMWENHIRGKRHLTNLKKLPGDMPSKTKTVLVQNRPAFILERIKHERPPGEPIVGLNEIRETEIFETNSQSYQCFLCGSCHTSIDIMEHLMSLKHRTKYLDHIDFPGREVIDGMSDSAASELVRDMCAQVEDREGMGKPALHVNKSSLQMYRG